MVRFLGNHQTEAQINLFSVQNAIISRFKIIIHVFAYFRYFVGTSGLIRFVIFYVFLQVIIKKMVSLEIECITRSCSLEYLA